MILINMIFKRNIQRYLVEWKADSNRKPLVIRGARQVGKTTVINEFARSFKHYISLNLEKPNNRIFFENIVDVKSVVETLFLAHNISIDEANKTILFIDEIQESPAAIRLLRYFYEDYPQLYVIAAGSLLEFAIKKVPSFPVGRIEYMYLHPLNFFEYLEAIGHNAAFDRLSEIPVKPFAHNVLLDLFNTYAIIGGMPEVIKVFTMKDSFTYLPKIYESIWSTFKNDVEKYTENATERNVIKHIMATAHLYLDNRIKFQNFGNSSYRSREVKEAMLKLNDARIVQLIYPTTDIEVPVKPDIKKSPRLQFLDTGLINYVLGIQADMIGMSDLSQAFKGAVIPHLVTQELISLEAVRDVKPNFWVREKSQSSSEVDLIYIYKNMVIPIEIKSGATGSLKSLHQFVERAGHPYAIRIYGGEFSIEKTGTPGGVPYILMNMPYYLGTMIPAYIEYFINNY